MKNQYKDFKIIKIDNKLYKITYFFTNKDNQYVLPSEVDEYIYTQLQKKILLPYSPYTVSYDSMTWFAISIIFEDNDYKLKQEVFEKRVSNIIDDDNKEDTFFYQIMRDILFLKYNFHFYSYYPFSFDKYKSPYFTAPYDINQESNTMVVDFTPIFYQMNLQEEKKE